MNHTFNFSFVLLGLLFFTSLAAKENRLFVSPTGSDQYSGSQTQPFASLQKALNVVQANRANGDQSFATIHLEGGTYPINKTLSLDESLSNIAIQGHPNDPVFFTGGTSIPLKFIEKKSGDDAPENYYTVKLKKAGITNYGSLRNVGFARPYGNAWGEIFVNKIPMHLSRWPNQKMIPMGKVLEQGSIPRNDDFTNRGGVIKYENSRIDKWANEKDPWMSGYFMWGYADDMVKIANINSKENTITTASATLYGFGYDKPWRQWYGVNLLCELDTPGEYYIDREEGVLHFISDEQAIESLEFSILEQPFLILESTQNVSISGITFECSRGLGIALSNTQNITIENCTFRNLGSLGITLGKGIKPFADYRHEGTGEAQAGIVGSLQQHLYANSTFNREGGKNNKIIGCHFYNLGAGGVILGGGNLLTLETGNNLVENCLFHDLNRIEKSYRPAVYLTGVGNAVRHCEIYNTPSMAIYLMFGNNNLIEYNYLHDVCLEVEDQGAIYYGRNPAEQGNIVRYNYFENIPDHFNTCAVYHDDGACGMTVFGNVFYQAGKWNVLLGGGSDNIYQNNIFIGNKIGIHIDNRLQNWSKGLLDENGLFEKRLKAVNYKNPPYSTQYPHLVNYFDNPSLPQRNLVENNVFVDVEQLLDGKKEWLDYKESNWETNEDPGFIDMGQKNFGLKEDALLFLKIKEFKNIPFNKIGIQ